jgi:hypothetical protein
VTAELQALHTGHWWVILKLNASVNHSLEQLGFAYGMLSSSDLEFSCSVEAFVFFGSLTYIH